MKHPKLKLDPASKLMKWMYHMTDKKQ